MTSGRVSGGPSRDADAPTRTSWTRDGIGAIVAVLALGLAFRFIIAQLNPGTGFSSDRSSFQGWAMDLAKNGIGGFYARAGFIDYTPGYLYVLYVIGQVGQAIGAVNPGDLIKIPAILADIVLGWLVWSMVLELGGGRRAALIGAALVVANPVTWYDSVIWGQVDSVGVVFLLLGVRELWRDRPERSAVFTVIAALIKPQLAILVPIVALVTIRRALWPPEPSLATMDDAAARQDGAYDAAPGILDRIRDWERRTDRPIRIATTAVAGFLTAVAMCFPFRLSVVEFGAKGQFISSGLVTQIFKAAAGYPYASVNAYNPWALASIRGNGLAANGTWACDVLIPNPAPGNIFCPEAVMIGPLPAVVVGALLLGAAFIAVALIVAWRPTPLMILTGVTVLAIAFFILPTRVHERYLFPFIILGAILAAISLRWRITYVVLSTAMFLNMYAILTAPLYKAKVPDMFGIAPGLRSQTGVTLIALAGLAAALWAFAQLRAGADRTLEAELAGEDFEDDWAPDADDLGPEAADLAPRSAWAASSAAASMAEPARRAATGAPPPAAAAARLAPYPTWTEPASIGELGPVGWFRSRLGQRPVRADRSRGLEAEPPGRLDRLDIWILVVLIAAILGIRMFRLGEPYQMHFDEVYHARTATEFLQDWRYGIDHDIYEWTHPHLAKYAMAAGLVAWGDDRVTATASLGVPVRDALIEPRTDDPDPPHAKHGDRVDIVTGSELRSYDLATRKLIATVPVPGASALALDETGDQLFIGGADGSVWTFDLGALDALRGGDGSDGLAAAPVAFAEVDGAIKHLYVPDDGSAVVVVTTDDQVRTLDPATAEVRGTVQLASVEDIGPAGTAPVLTATPGSVDNPKAVASTLATLLGGSAATYEQRLAGTADRLEISQITTTDTRSKLEAAIKDHRLDGLAIETLPRIAIADGAGLDILDPTTGEKTSTMKLGGAAHGVALTTVDGAKLYVAIDPDPAAEVNGRIAIVAVGGDAAKNGPSLVQTMKMPGLVSKIAYDNATEMVHVLGRTPDGSSPTIYVLEPHANPPSIYADARLPFEPAALVLDAARPYPTEDREQILAFDGDGQIASVDIGKHEFAWRLPGVLAGTAMAAFLYLLARILFRRRTVALFVALFCAVDGMFFVQSRIGMNDAYVGLGIVAAYTVFAALWTGTWRRRGAFWIGMPLIGAFLGLALASKWVALYAILGMGFLVLIRSALGRFLAIAALVVMTAVLGYLAINVPAGTGFGNLPFVAIMVGLTVAAVVINILHPLRWSLDEIRFAIGGPVVLGGILALAAITLNKAGAGLKLGSLTVTPLEIAATIAALGIVAWAAFAGAARLGFGPLAPPPAPDEPAALLPPPSAPPELAWLRPGAQLGLPIVWMVVCLLALPIAIYVVSYIPWAVLDNHVLIAGWPAGHTGQSLTDLTGAMYAYHNDLGTPHAAESPWWAWLFDMKPVWFYQEGLAGNTTASIYDAGNIVIWWLGLPALAFAAWQAFARRSLALALVTIGFAFQWVAWARIDRAAFQYHYYTSLPFLFLALAYFLAELWHGASWRTWVLARLAAAVAVLGPAILWVLARPLCGFVNVDKANPNSQACPPYIPQFLLTTQTAALAAIVGVTVLIVIRLFGRLGDDSASGDRDRDVGGRSVGGSTVTLGLLGLTAVAAIAASAAARAWIGDTPLITWNRIPVEPVAIVLALPAVAIAAFVATARDARRFVIGAIVAIVGWFVIVYPNFSALPLPTAIANVYQGVLPTYPYPFQFPINNVASKAKIELFGPVPLLLGASVVFLCVVVGYSAWVWRLALAERLADERDAADLGASWPRGAGGGAAGD